MEEARESLEDGEYCPHLPAMSDDVLIDAAGNAWLGHRHHPGGTTERWAVFDPRGVWLGMVDTPPSFEVLSIAADRIIGVARGDFDVPYVEVRRLDRSGPNAGR